MSVEHEHPRTENERKLKVDTFNSISSDCRDAGRFDDVVIAGRRVFEFGSDTPPALCVKNRENLFPCELRP